MNEKEPKPCKASKAEVNLFNAMNTLARFALGKDVGEMDMTYKVTLSKAKYKVTCSIKLEPI